MLATIRDPAFTAELERAILAHCKEVHEITYVEHSADNVVALVNKAFVFRFPRDERAARRLVFETALLQKLQGRLSIVPIPEVAEVHHEPLYVVANYIEGAHLSGPEIKALNETEQQAIGQTIAQFMHQLNQAISGLEVQRLRTEASIDSLDEAWPQYFERLFEKEPLPDDKLRPIVDQYYPLWQEWSQQEQHTYAIHDDLHPSNLLFRGPRLSGIVDFGDANVGSLESEMRWLYLMGDIVLKAAITQYQALTGTLIAYEHVRLWAIMHELSSYTNRLAREETDSYPFKRAETHLREWVKDFPL